MTTVEVFKIRLHGETNWERIATRVNAQNIPLILGEYEIESPEAKTDYVDVNGIDGVLDFTEAAGLHFDMRDITVELISKKRVCFDFNSFKRKYLGQIVDVAFWESDSHYYTGRLSISADNHARIRRALQIKINADPFKYPISGKSELTIQHAAIPLPYKITDDSFSESVVIPRKVGDQETEYVWAELPIGDMEGYYALTLSNTAGPESFTPAIAIPVDVTPGNIYLFDGSDVNFRSVPKFRVYQNNGTTEIDREAELVVTHAVNGYINIFMTPEECTSVYIEIENESDVQMVLQLLEIATMSFDAGEKNQCPDYNSSEFQRSVCWGSKNRANYAVLPKRSTWTPAFTLNSGVNKIAILPDVDNADTESVIEFEKAVLG